MLGRWIFLPLNWKGYGDEDIRNDFDSENGCGSGNHQSGIDEAITIVVVVVMVVNLKEED